MNFQRLLPDCSLPILVTTNSRRSKSLDSLVNWAAGNHSLIDQHLYDAGALLIRGFDVLSATDFKLASAAISTNLQNYTGGDAPRFGVIDKVYISTEYPKQLEVLLHNELSYAGWCPGRILFCCLITAKSGGETQIADGRRIYNSLDPGVRDRFENKGITYLQHLWDKTGPPGAGKSWQETFETECKATAEDYLYNASMQFEWTDLGIRTSATKPASRVHPMTEEKCWHNQADQWHRDMDSPKNLVSGTGELVKNTTSGEQTLGNHVCFGDGSPINTADLYHIREVSKNCEVVFSWQQGDIMVIDNILTMHGRKPFQGDRQVLVTMA
jgi:hypothetical protein